jgi:hypothetical protein
VTPFEHLTVLVSIVIGMGITHLLITARELVQVRSRVKLYWLPMLWFVPIFIALVERWWAIFALHSTIKWNFFYFLFMLMSPVAQRSEGPAPCCRPERSEGPAPSFQA